MVQDSPVLPRELALPPVRSVKLTAAPPTTAASARTEI
jgi:hypothetical protein